MATTAIPKRQLGLTDMEITRVGFGAWAIGGHEWAVGWGPQDDKQSIAAIRHAVQRGINWIDTAPIYGLGHSEEIVRQALSEISANERPYVFTKCGLAWDNNNRHAFPRRKASPDRLLLEVEDSLRRLGVEQIDLYQMHWPSQDGTPVEEYWRALLDMKKEGKVRAVGLSNHNVEQLEAAERVGHVDTLQPPFSAIRREFAANELPWCITHETGVIVYSPMQAGLLTGAFSQARAATLPSSDWRSRDPEFTGDNLKRNLELVEALESSARRHSTSVAAVAVAWTLAWPGICGAIVGARKLDQVDGWLDAASLELSRQDLEEIAGAIHRTGAGAGPALPQ